ncbi:MAG: NEL-type E3 ubiquitin ligase domain-containing protein [Candidimonas sp.]
MTELGRLKSFCKLRTLAGENYKNRFSHRSGNDGIRVYTIELGMDSKRNPSIELSKKVSDSLKRCDDSLAGLRRFGADHYQILGHHFTDTKVAAALVREAREHNSTTLDFSRCPFIISLPEDLPESLEILNLGGCDALTSLPGHLPKALRELDLGCCLSLRALPDELPESLVTLNIDFCQSLTRLPETLPDSLVTLRLRDCQWLTALPSRLPESLVELCLMDCPALRALPDSLPDSLKILNLHGCSLLTVLPNTLPRSLESLDVSNCGLLTALPDALPDSLVTFTLINCRLLTALPNTLPASLASLSLNNCRLLTALPNILPDSLAFLDLSDCRSLTVLPDTLPGSLTYLSLRNCSSLMALPNNLPYALRLDLSGCPARLPPRPAQEQWYGQAGKSEAEIRVLRDAWGAIEGEPLYPHFSGLLERLSGDRLRGIVRAQDVANVIEEIVVSPRIRTPIFEEAESANNNCVDRPLTLFNTIQSLARFNKLQREGAADTQILELAQGMLKTALLDEASILVMTKQWREGRRFGNANGNGPNMREGLEVQLELRRVLGEELNLPFRVRDSLHSRQLANLNDSDIQFVKQHVNETMGSPARKYLGLMATPMWQSYMQKVCETDITNVTDQYDQLLDELEEEFDDTEERMFDEGSYVKSCSLLAADRQGDIDQVMIERTKAVDELHQRVLQDREMHSMQQYA